MKIKIGLFHIIFFITLAGASIYYQSFYYKKIANNKIMTLKSRVVTPTQQKIDKVDEVVEKKEFDLSRDLFNTIFEEEIELSDEMRELIRSIRVKIKGVLVHKGAGSVVLVSGDIISRGENLLGYEIVKIDEKGVYIAHESKQLLLIKVWED